MRSRCPAATTAEVARRNLILKRWLFSIIGAALFLYKGVPGAQPRLVLALSGGQHIGKTTWAAKLFRGIFPGSDECYMGGSRFGTDKDSIEKLIKHLVCELGELETSTGKTGELKQFLSSDVDEYRRPYDAEVSKFHRRSVYLGTVNPDGNGFLPDQTGNSRFGVVNVTKVDLNAIDALLEGDGVHQLWSEIQTKCLEAWRECHAYLGKVVPGKPYAPWLLTAEEIELIGVGNEAHREYSDSEEVLRELFDFADKNWLASKKKAQQTGEYRLMLTSKDNLMTISQIRTEVQNRMRKPVKGLRAVLQRMTGMPDSFPTTVTKNTGKPEAEMTEEEKEANRVKGRYWGMPPRINEEADKVAAGEVKLAEAQDAFADIDEGPDGQGH